MRNDADAIRLLTEQLARFPGNAAITTALTGRQRARDGRITELIQRARGANDEKAVEFLDSALALNPARADVRAERERRAFAIRRVQIEKAAREMLDKFESAFEARNVAQFVNIATYRTAADIGQEFQAYRSIRVDIDDVTITVQPDGTATVSVHHPDGAPAGGRRQFDDRQPPVAVENCQRRRRVADYRSGAALVDLTALSPDSRSCWPGEMRSRATSPAANSSTPVARHPPHANRNGGSCFADRHDARITIEEHDVDREAHADGMNGAAGRQPHRAARRQRTIGPSSPRRAFARRLGQFDTGQFAAVGGHQARVLHLVQRVTDARFRPASERRERTAHHLENRQRSARTRLAGATQTRR